MTQYVHKQRFLFLSSIHQVELDFKKMMERSLVQCGDPCEANQVDCSVATHIGMFMR